MAIREAHQSSDDPDIGWGLRHLASVLYDQGDLERARVLLERALAIDEARMGTEHPDTLKSRADLRKVVESLQHHG